MRTYDITDADGNVLSSQTVDDSIAPSLLAGQFARLVAVDGDALAKSSRPVIGAVGPGDEVPTMPETLVTEEEEAAAKAAAKAARAAAAAEKTAAAAKAEADAAAAADAGREDAAANSPEPLGGSRLPPRGGEPAAETAEPAPADAPAG